MGIIYDVKARKVVTLEQSGGWGTRSGAMSFDRFVDLLRASGEVSNLEEITHIEFNTFGISYSLNEKARK